jgi:diguanylate cyclase (GGDEF)-like protein/PAS domain S-box-containing protein
MDDPYAAAEALSDNVPAALLGSYHVGEPTMPGLRTFDDRLLQLETIYDTLPIALYVISRDGRVIFANEAYAALVSRPVHDLIGVPLSEISETESRHAALDFLTFDGGDTMPERELLLQGRTYLVSVAPLRGVAGQVEAISVAHTEITYRKTLEAKLAVANRRLADLAVKDHLTGLFNRRHFDEALSSALGRATRSRSPLSMLMIDVDHFKLYNDTYGHPDGDECLRAVAGCLAATLDDSAILCRFGGEEFGAILCDADEYAAADIAERMRFAVAAAGRAHGGSPLGRVTVSVGVATERPRTTHVQADLRDRLLAAADSALYRAKATGRNRVVMG